MIQGTDSTVKGGALRYGMVGGGPGAFIGEVHRKAIALDGTAELLAGCFSRDFEKALALGRELGVAEDRLYRSYEEMAEQEATRADGIDFVSIVTPNHLHYAAAKAFLTRGINVACDKPLCWTVEQAEELVRLAEEKDLLFAVTYTYSAYPMVKQAREMVRRGDLGEIRVVVGEYPQDWLATGIEREGQKQAAWRTDPCQSGISNCVGDIGSHIENTVAQITGLKVKSLCASLDIFGEGRQLDDNAAILVKYTNGATGVYWASQVAIGHDNGLKVRVFGTKGSLEFEQENPNYLRVAYLGGPVQILTRGAGYLYPPAARLGRIPTGHPEGYFEAFANLYSAFGTALRRKKAGEAIGVDELDFPTGEDGLSGVRFINRAVESSAQGGVWVDLD